MKQRGLVVGTSASHAKGPGSIPGMGISGVDIVFRKGCLPVPCHGKKITVEQTLKSHITLPKNEHFSHEFYRNRDNKLVIF